MKIIELETHPLDSYLHMADDSTLKIKFGKAVRQLRKERGLTQNELCKITHLDIKHLSKIENGFTNASLDVIERLSKSFAVEISSLFKLTESM